MKYVWVLFAITTLLPALSIADEPSDFQGLALPAEIQQELIQRGFVSNPRAPRPRMALAPTGRVPKPGAPFTSCAATTTGGGFELRLSKEAAFEDPKAKWSVSLLTPPKDLKGPGTWNEVKNAKVELIRDKFFDEVQRNTGGFVGLSFTVSTWTARFQVSADQVLGQEFRGCMPGPVKTVNVVVLCFQSQPGRR